MTQNEYHIEQNVCHHKEHAFTLCIKDTLNYSQYLIQHICFFSALCGIIFRVEVNWNNVSFNFSKLVEFTQNDKST